MWLLVSRRGQRPGDRSLLQKSPEPRAEIAHINRAEDALPASDETEVEGEAVPLFDECTSNTCRPPGRSWALEAFDPRRGKGEEEEEKMKTKTQNNKKKKKRRKKTRKKTTKKMNNQEDDEAELKDVRTRNRE